VETRMDRLETTAAEPEIGADRLDPRLKAGGAGSGARAPAAGRTTSWCRSPDLSTLAKKGEISWPPKDSRLPRSSAAGR
jgi:hypothetical protein